MSGKNKNYNEIEKRDNMVIQEVEEVITTTEKKELKTIITKEPTKVKRGLLSRFTKGVLGPEGVSGIGEYVNEEIIKPAIKNIIVDAVTSGINMIMYGERGGSNRNNSRPGTNYNRSYQQTNHQTNYTSRYTSSNPEPSNHQNNKVARPARYGVEEYVINDRYDASHVLTTLTENADMYGSVSVADYYDLIGVGSQYTDNQYGWTIDTITRATIVPVRGGYTIRLPQVEVI